MDIMNLEARVEEVGVIRGAVTVPNKIGNITVNGTYDYNELVNKPKINGVELVGAQSLNFALAEELEWRFFDK